MDAVIVTINVMMCLVLALAACWAVLSPAVDDGVLVKLGLIGISLGFFGAGMVLAATGDQPGMRGINRSLLLVHVGIIVVMLGYSVRARRHRTKRRRKTDWASLDEHGAPQ